MEGGGGAVSVAAENWLPRQQRYQAMAWVPGYSGTRVVVGTGKNRSAEEKKNYILFLVLSGRELPVAENGVLFDRREWVVAPPGGGCRPRPVGPGRRSGREHSRTRPQPQSRDGAGRVKTCDHVSESELEDFLGGTRNKTVFNFCRKRQRNITR